MLVNLATPLLTLLYWGYRLASLEVFRRRAPRGWRQGSEKGFPNRILIVRLDTIGDVLLSEPAIRDLRQAFPEARLDVVTGAAGRAVLSGNPCIDKFVAFDAPWHAAWRGGRIHWRSEIAKALRTLRDLRRSRYDLAVELRGDPRDIAFMALTGAAVKVGNGWRGGSFMLDIDADVDVESHRVVFAQGIAGAIGATAGPCPPKMWFGDSERDVAAKYLPEQGTVRYIAIHLGAGFPSKCLPVEKFAAVGAALTRASSTEPRQVVLIGGRDDGVLAEDFKRLYPGSAIDLAGKLSLLETAAVLERCALFVGNDSGPMHIAASVGTPVVACFGPSEPHKYRPHMANYRLLELDLPCRPCDHVHCSQPENVCMTGIEATEVLLAAEELLQVREDLGQRIR